ncbi:hypothetical protein LCGC14_0360200 [marine sediment metagenome]|uniref:Rubredoxin-like domain-containing protein n=1 Tax=marine sediment metagenome TaxID=412755 RepID=A0A0F9VVJ7_9ZZZZ
MEIQLGKNPEYTIWLVTDLSYWALPICIYWYGPHDHTTGIVFNISLKILCFGLTLEIWKWGCTDTKIAIYTNECYECGHEWYSETEKENCPECSEEENIGTDLTDLPNFKGIKR